MKSNERRCFKCEKVKDDKVFRVYVKYGVRTISNACLDCTAEDRKILAKKVREAKENKGQYKSEKHTRSRNYVPASSLSDRDREQNYKNFKVF